MTPDTAIAKVSHLRKRWPAESCAAAEPREERKTTAAPEPRSHPRKPRAVRVFQPEISSFRLHLAAEGKAAKTIRNYVEAVQWFAAAHLLADTCRTRWEQVSGQDIERWMVQLPGRYSQAYASNQYRALQQFFKWLAEEDEFAGLPGIPRKRRPGCRPATRGTGQGFYGRKPTPELRL
jgi:Phage integrase, N-terminal SAM-like domain